MITQATHYSILTMAILLSLALAVARSGRSVMSSSCDAAAMPFACTMSQASGLSSPHFGIRYQIVFLSYLYSCTGSPVCPSVSSASAPAVSSDMMPKSKVEALRPSRALNMTESNNLNSKSWCTVDQGALCSSSRLDQIDCELGSFGEPKGCQPFSCDASRHALALWGHEGRVDTGLDRIFIFSFPTQLPKRIPSSPIEKYFRPFSVANY